jgi:hypothetical protein
MGGGTATGGGAGTGGGSAVGGGSGGGAVDAGCQPNWSCSPWYTQSPSDGGAQRGCFDQNQCMPAPTPPPQTAALPGLDFPFFQCKVQPVLAKTCGMAGCHGGTFPIGGLIVYSRGRSRLNQNVTLDLTPFGCETGTQTVNLATDSAFTASCRGLIPLTAAEWSIDYDSARSFGFDNSGGTGIYLTNLDGSQLLNDLVRGTFPHQNVKTWSSKSDPQYDVIRQWLDGGTASPNCNAGTNN